MNENKTKQKEPVIKSVTKEEFQDYIESYPRKLVKHVYNDIGISNTLFSDLECNNNWRKCIVAAIYVNDGSNPLQYWPKTTTIDYYVIKNHEELFESIKK